MGGLRL
jgi:hypothetical protein